MIDKLLWRARLTVLAVVLPPTLFVSVLYVLPAIIMFSYSFWTLDQDYRLVPAWNLQQYEYFFSQSTYLSILARSFRLALANTTLSVLIAYPLAYFISHYVKSHWKNLLLVLLIAPSWTSFLIRIYSWMLVLGDNGLINYGLRSLGLTGEPLPLLFNQGSVLVGLLYVYLPYTLLPIYASLEKIDPSLLEAARALGAHPLRAFVRVTLPLSKPGILAGAMITFIPTLGEYVAPALLGGRTGYMYGNLIAEQFSIFDWPLGAAMAAILLVCVLTLMVVFGRLVRLDEVWSS
jgi:ABC-type spermidine/putrescine transport system permease subunit I